MLSLHPFSCMRWLYFFLEWAFTFPLILWNTILYDFYKLHYNILSIAKEWNLWNLIIKLSEKWKSLHFPLDEYSMAKSEELSFSSHFCVYKHFYHFYKNSNSNSNQLCEKEWHLSVANPMIKCCMLFYIFGFSNWNVWPSRNTKRKFVEKRKSVPMCWYVLFIFPWIYI